jgi:deoxyribonuclease-4
MEIWLGPAGNAIGAKEKGTEGSLKYLKEIGLNAQEIEFVRNVYLTEKRAEEIGDLAKNLGIKLSVHAPYYINLNSDKKQTVEKSIKFILDSLDRAERMNADCVVVHAAYYGGLTKEETFNNVKECMLKILDKMKDRKMKTKLAIETMAKQSQFGDLDEIIKLCKEVKSKQLTVCVDFAHLFVRNGGKINYQEIFNKLKVLKLKQIFSHFSNVKYNVNTKKFVDIHVPINSHPSFKELAKEIAKRKVDMTIICESPILEKDSLKMKKILKKFHV